MSRFARLANRDRYALQKIFARKELSKSQLLEISEAIKNTEATGDKVEISEWQVEKLSKAIKRMGGVVKFSLDNPEFPETSVYQILSGRRKRLTPKVKELMAFCRVK